MTSSPRGSSTLGNASSASRMSAKARSSRTPCSTSWITDKQVTISPAPRRSSSDRPCGRRKSSIQADVSTSRTALPGAIDTCRLADGCRSIAAHLAEIALPHTRTGVVGNAIRLRSLDEFRQCALDGACVCLLPAHSDRLIEQALIKHNICAFHTHTLAHGDGGPRRVRPRPAGRYRPFASASAFVIFSSLLLFSSDTISWISVCPFTRNSDTLPVPRTVWAEGPRSGCAL